MITAFIMSNTANNDLSSDPVYQERLAAGHKPPREKALISTKPGAKTSVLIFLIGIIVSYSTQQQFQNIGLSNQLSLVEMISSAL